MVIHVRVSLFVMCCHQILMNVRASMEDVKYTISTRMAHTIVIIKKGYCIASDDTSCWGKP